MTPTFTREEIQTWLIDHIAQLLKVDSREIEAQQPFDRLGIDSLAVAQINRGLESFLGTQLPLGLIDHFEAIANLAEFLACDSPDELATKVQELEAMRPLAAEPEDDEDPYTNHSLYTFLDPVYFHKTEVMVEPDWVPPFACCQIPGGVDPPNRLEVDYGAVHEVLSHHGIGRIEGPGALEESLGRRLKAFQPTGLELHLCASGSPPAWYRTMRQASPLEDILGTVLEAREWLSEEHIFPVDYSRFRKSSIVTASTLDETFYLFIEDLARTLGVFDHGHIHPAQLEKELCAHLEDVPTSGNSNFQLQGANRSLLVSDLTSPNGDPLMVAGVLYRYEASIDTFTAQERYEVKTLTWSAERWSICFTSEQDLMDVYGKVGEASVHQSPSMSSQRIFSTSTPR